VAAYRAVMGVLRVSAFVLLLAALAATAVFESRSMGAAEPGSSVAAAGTAAVSLDQAVKMAEQRFKARVVRAEAQRDGVRTIYVLKLLNEAGHVWTVRVDAANGVIL
jgi:uncharacterized membrane protein YkoI